jgi:hydrogenase nickel incorporation protein HypA/HybF
MHEKALAEGVLQIVDQTARREGFRRVALVVLEIGRLSAVEPEAMRFCFESVIRGSLADGAKLEIRDVPGRALCLSCGHEVELAHRYDPYPKCDSFPLRVTGGAEMRVKEIEGE